MREMKEMCANTLCLRTKAAGCFPYCKRCFDKRMRTFSRLLMLTPGAVSQARAVKGAIQRVELKNGDNGDIWSLGSFSEN